jgi:glycine/D-amino acid oxidase-like deaminating enzyme
MQTPVPGADTCDLLIMGGGLAGLTLALQLRQRFPALDIRVLERRRHPVPEAAHKVGESSVELRSEERRVGKECRRLCRSRWSPYH